MLEFVTSLILVSSDHWLRWLEIPHLREGNSIEIVGQSLNVQLAWWSPLSPLLFLLAAGLYSMLRKRSWAVLLANLVSAFCWWFILQVVLVTSAAWLRHRGLEVSSAVTTSACLLACVLLFLSAERGIRGLLAPVSDGADNARRANPLVVGWNRMVTVRERTEASS